MSTESTKWDQLPAPRLRTPGSSGASAVTIAMRTACALLALSLLWHVFVLLRPLPHPPSTASTTPPATTEFAWRASNLEQRQAYMDSLQGVNHYAHDRLPWTTDLPPGTPAQPGLAHSESSTSSRPAGVATASGELLIDDVESLPEDIKQARDSLKLRGIRSTLTGGFAAHISLVHTKNPLASTTYRVGDTFTDPKHAAAEWRIAAIDPRRDRVVLERSGKRVALDLYPVFIASLPRAIDSIYASPGAVGAVSIEQKSREQVISELLDAELSTQDIHALLDLIDAESLPEIVRREIPDPEEVVQRMRQAHGAAPPPSNDMQLLIKLMSSGQNPVEFMEQQAEQAKAEEEDE